MSTLQIAYEILYSLEHKKKADYMGQIISPTALDVRRTSGWTLSGCC